jgi:hypothetical protein
VAPPSRFPARVYVGDTIQFIAQKGDREGGPPLCQVSRTPTPLSFNGRGVPVFFLAGAPPYPLPPFGWRVYPSPRYPRRYPPSRFPARVYVGDTIQFIAQKGDREGGPPGFHERGTPTPLSSQGEGGPPLGLGRGGGGTPPSRHRSMTGTPLPGTQGGTPLLFSGTGLHRRLHSGFRPKRGSGGVTLTSTWTSYP